MAIGKIKFMEVDIRKSIELLFQQTVIHSVKKFDRVSRYWNVLKWFYYSNGIDVHSFLLAKRINTLQSRKYDPIFSNGVIASCVRKLTSRKVMRQTSRVASVTKRVSGRTGAPAHAMQRPAASTLVINLHLHNHFQWISYDAIFGCHRIRFA